MEERSHDAGPRVTIITTFRDAAAFLGECIASVRAQTEPRFVHRLVDDGSIDGSLAIARAAAHEDARLEVIALAGAGRRAALAAAHRDVATELVAWVDADDVLEPEALARTLEVMSTRPACGLVFTDHTRIDREGRPTHARARAPFTRDGMLVEFATFHFRLIRRAAFEAAGGIAPDLEVGIDYDLCLRLSEVAEVTHLAEPLYRYREHAGQISTTRRREQVTASASAVRRAIERRGLADVAELRVERRTGRFLLRTRSASTPQRWHDHARAAARALVGRRAPSTVLPRTISVWPAARDDVLAASLADGFHRRALGLVPVPPSLPALLRSTWSGRIGDVLLLQGIASALREHAAGPRSAQRRLLRAALDRARAQGARIVWCTWTDAADPRLDPDTTDAVLHCCDALVLGSAGALAVGSDAQTIVTAPGHLLELHPIVGRATARARLGLPEGVPVFVRPGTLDDPAHAIEIVAAFLEHATAGAQLVIRAAPPRDAVARTLGASAIDAPNVHWLLHPTNAPSLATVIAAADAVLVGDGPEAWPLALVAAARGRATVLPEGSHASASPLRHRNTAELGRLLAALAVDRTAAAEAGRSALARTRAVSSADVADRILEALRQH